MSANGAAPAPLLARAAQALESAHAPYSRFRVGAALLAADGAVFVGCNVENASYGLTICAERVAVATAVAAGKREFAAMAIVAAGGTVPYPCGACRQVLAEFCGPDFPVYAAGSRNMAAFERFRLNELLPHAFRTDPVGDRGSPRSGFRALSPSTSAQGAAERI